MTTATLPRNLPGLHDYELVQLLGEGGMGKAFLARHKPSSDHVVVKTMHEHLLRDAKSRQRFEQEADLMRRFRHPNAVTFLRASAPTIEPPFIIMEYVEGITLEDLILKHERLSPVRVGRLLAELCLFLQAAHDNGLLHRDLTPANVMVVDEGTNHESIKVMDFGLARRLGFYIPSGQLNQQSSIIDGGTPDYICPEQLAGKQVDHRGDLFSVGVLLYGLLTGHVPFEELKKPIDIMLANLHQPPPRFSHWHVTGVPSTIEQLVLSCIAKSPADRPESARALIETYELGLGQRLLHEEAFDESAHLAISTLQERNRINPANVIDQFEAMMPEQVAAIKLRGFVEGVDGEVGECDAGVIKFRMPRIVEMEVKKGLWNWFTRTDRQIDWIPLELHMAKKQAGTRSMVDITVVRPRLENESAEQAALGTQFCQQICMELRAYLMAGR